MVLSFDTAWSELQTVWVQPCVRTAGLVPPVEHKATTQELVAAYTLCYRMCTQRNPHNWSAALHKRFQEVLWWHVQERLLPGLLSSASSGRALLMEVACVWGQYKALVHEFQRPFHYLERYYVPANRLPSNALSGYHVFREALLSTHIKTPLQHALASHASALCGCSSEEARAGVWAVLGPALQCLNESQANEGLGVSELVHAPLLQQHPLHRPPPPLRVHVSCEVAPFPMGCVSPSPRSCSMLMDPTDCPALPHWDMHEHDKAHQQQQQQAQHAQSLLPPCPSVPQVHGDPQEPLLKGFLPLAPSQGSLCQAFHCLKLRALCSPPLPPPHSPAPADPTSPRGPPTKLSRLGFASFSSSTSASAVCSASRVAVGGEGQWALAGHVLREVVTTLKDDLFVELLDTLYAPVTDTTPFPLTNPTPLPSLQ